MLSQQKNKKKILILCPYPENQAAGQRLKYEQYISDWESNNYEVHHSSFMSLDLWNILYKKGFLFQKIKHTIFGYIERIKILSKIKNYDYIYVFMWVTPLGSSFFEKMVRKRSKRLIYDIEDNVLEREQKNESPFHKYFYKFLRSKVKIQYLIKNADHVIASSPYLASYYCKRLNKFNSSTFISSSLNMNYYKINNQKEINRKKNKDQITIGWTGTFSSKIYLESISNILKKLSKQIDFKLLIIGNFDYSIEGVNIEVVHWTAKNEISDLNRIDIGIYPLLDDKWVLGKSGLKALQYMALGIPTVATDVGTTNQIIDNMKDGILVNNEDEWLKALKLLINDSELRYRIGKKARIKVEKNYSTNIIRNHYLKVFKDLSRINVGLFFSSGELGGAEKSLTKMAKSDYKINYRIFLYASKGPFVDWLEYINIPKIFLGKNINFISLIRSIYQIKFSNLDVVYVCGLKISLALRVLLIFNKKIKFVNAVRHSPFSKSRYDRVYILLERFTKYFVDHYITNSISAKNILINKINIFETKVSNIYNGLDYFPNNNEIIPIVKRKNLVITVANINHRKGHIAYLNIIKKLVNDFKEIKFLFIGRDDLNGKVQKEIKNLNLQNYIDFVGFKKDVNHYYKNAKISVLPSNWGEGSPTSIIESMSWGTPVISYDVGGCSEIITNNFDGIVVKRNQPDLLYNAIKNLLLNHKLLTKMSNTGLSSSKKYLLENCTNQHKNVFTNLVNQ